MAEERGPERSEAAAEETTWDEGDIQKGLKDLLKEELLDQTRRPAEIADLFEPADGDSALDRGAVTENRASGRSSNRRQARRQRDREEFKSLGSQRQSMLMAVKDMAKVSELRDNQRRELAEIAASQRRLALQDLRGRNPRSLRWSGTSHRRTDGAHPPRYG